MYICIIWSQNDRFVKSITQWHNDNDILKLVHEFLQCLRRVATFQLQPEVTWADDIWHEHFDIVDTKRDRLSAVTHAGTHGVGRQTSSTPGGHWGFYCHL